MLIETQTQQQIASENIANTLISNINEELKRRLDLHIYLHDLLWNDPTATPQEVCDKLLQKGFKPALLFQMSAKNLQNLSEICTLFDKTLSDFVDIQAIAPKLPYIINNDGSITIES